MSKPLSSSSVSNDSGPLKELRYLYIFAFVVAGINLLIVNDFATFWNGAEVNMVLQLAQTESLQFLVQANEFFVRIPNVLVTILGFAGIFFLGRKIFGASTTLDTLLVLASSLVVINLSKVATGDSWLFALLSLNFITLILFIKQPILKWKIVHLLLLFFAAGVHPVSTLVFSVGTSLYLFLLHPKGKNILQLHHGVLWLILLPLFYVLGFWQWSLPTFYMGYGNIEIDEYLLWMMVGMLPWTGFLWASLWEMLQKLRKKEEFAIITSSGLLVGLFSHSLVVQTILAFMIARQLTAYFHPNYPYKNIVKTGAILHLLAAFTGIVFMMITSFDFFQAVGFRSAMAVGAIYWMTCLGGVIGLVGMNVRFIKGGMALSGLMLTMVFWLQLYPLVESERNLPKRIALDAEQLRGTSETDSNIYVIDSTNPTVQNIQLYLSRHQFTPQNLETDEDFKTIYQKGEMILLSDERFQQAKTQLPDLDGQKIVGWGPLLQEKIYWLLKK